MNETNKLQRKLSPLNVWALALGCIIGWGAFVMPGDSFLPVAGPIGTCIAMAIAAVIMIIISITYHYMINKFPVTGGGFTHAYEAFGEKHGFLCSWFLSLSYLSIVPLNAMALSLIAKNLIGGIFQVGFLYEIAGYKIYIGEILLCICALVIFALLSIKGVKFSGIFQSILVFCLVGGVIIIAIGTLISDKANFNNLTPMFSPDVAPSVGILSVICLAPWAFVGFDTIPQAAEEFNFSPKKSKLIMIAAIIFGASIYVILTITTTIILPQGYSNWFEYIKDIPTLEGLISMPTFYSAQEALSSFGLFFIGIAVCGAILSGIIGFFMATSRLLYSMSKRNIIPKFFSHINKKYKTPSKGILFVLVISLIAPFFGRNALLWIVDMSSIGAALGYMYTTAAAFKFAKIENNKRIMITGLIGTIISLFFVVIRLIPIPALIQPLQTESYISLLIWVILGLIFYIISKRQKTENK